MAKNQPTEAKAEVKEEVQPVQEVKEVKAEVKKSRYPENYQYKSETKQLGYIESASMHNQVRIFINRGLPAEVVEDIYKAFDDVLAFHNL